MNGTSKKDIQKDIQRTELLVQVARLYYEHNYSQNDIAKRLGLSRPYISKLLAAARQNGIVRIEINDPTSAETRTERQLREYFKLNKVIVVPRTQDVSHLQQVGEAAARYLRSIVKSGDVIGFSWGETVYECAKALVTGDDLRDVTMVQMCGGVSDVKRKVYVAEIIETFSGAFGNSGYVLPFPAIVDNEQIKNVISKEHTIQDVLRYSERANIALITMGKFGLQSALARAGYLTPQEIEQLTTMGAVGDICTHVINAEGEICDRALDARTVAVPYERIKNIRTRIGVAIGDDKAESILGALRGHVINVFITNEETAEAIGNVCPEVFERSEAAESA